MKLLAIESTCDETAAAVVESCGAGVRVVSSIIASSAKMQQKYGGVVPEVAAREQVASVIPVITEALGEHKDSIEAIAVSFGPGLMGSLLIGIETAKVLSWTWKRPLLKVNHMAGHIMANWIVEDELEMTPTFPSLALVVSGGHSDLVILNDINNWKWVGGTRDDAVGEAFDKSARILGLPYPGGPEIEKAANQASEEKWKKEAKNFRLPRPMINNGNLEMSFSGIKAALARMVEKEEIMDQEMVNLMAREFTEAVTDVLLDKTRAAILSFRPKSVILAGGVAANKLLRERLRSEVEKNEGISFFVPESKYCGDNAAMVGAAAILNPQQASLNLRPDPNLQTV